MLLKSVEDQLLLYHHFRIHKSMLLYVPPVLLVLGTFGNVLSFIILTRQGMRKVSSYVYLAVLSLTDTLVLYVGLLRLWIAELMEYDIRNHADWICKTISVLGYTVSDYSVWLIIAVTVERYIAVCHALRANSMCNRTRAAKVIISIGVIILAINFHFFFTTQIRMTKVEGRSETVGKCNPAEGFDQLFVVWHFVDAFIYSFLPFVILSVLNGLIIHKVLIAKRSRHVLSERVHYDQGKRGGQSPSHNRGHHGESSARLTVMLLTISFAFVITTLPMNINLSLNFYWNNLVDSLKNEDEKYRMYARAKLVGTIAELLMYTNHSMNFFLYCATGQKFREQLVKLFLCTKRTQNGQVCSHNNTYRTRFQDTQMERTNKGNQHGEHGNHVTEPRDHSTRYTPIDSVQSDDV